MKYLIVGLGNPGEKYANTRHNIGFKVLDEFANQTESKFAIEKLADVARAKYKGKTVILVKPNTFMNLSGKALNYWMQQEKIPLEHVMVITDDIALPFGKMRMKGKGSDGGHNGLKDIQRVLGNDQYVRLRIGVGNDFHPGQQADYVLSDWSAEETGLLNERLTTAAEFIKGFVSVGLERTMTLWNNK